MKDKLELIILGKQKPSNEEIEIFPNAKQKYGFDVILTKRNDGTKTIYRNATEYHHMYKESLVKDWDGWVKGESFNCFAIESDIHCTGYTPWDIFNQFSRIEVVESDKIYEDFYN